MPNFIVIHTPLIKDSEPGFGENLDREILINTSSIIKVSKTHAYTNKFEDQGSELLISRAPLEPEMIIATENYWDIRKCLEATENILVPGEEGSEESEE